MKKKRCIIVASLKFHTDYRETGHDGIVQGQTPVKCWLVVGGNQDKHNSNVDLNTTKPCIPGKVMHVSADGKF